MAQHRKPLYYTFGNHMHWVDMQWLWGYGVLPGSVRDMLALCERTGAKGCVNFDGIGYEKMAAECPEALQALREAVAAGTIEPVGCSYGQPYGLFHGGESNIRQFAYGVRAVLRLLGVRPSTFWEEEFYFFPQLPQVLTSCGFSGANLFFQWTWHTPEVPRERASLILWEGADGTRIPALPRNDLNVHQWPEDFDGLLEQGLINDLDAPAIVQWLELMPSKDWMCRSEVLLPRLEQLFADPRFELRPVTCAELIERLLSPADTDVASPPVRHYTPDDVWHGMSLGKNGDAHPRASRYCEDRLLLAEGIAATASLLGRPYPSWDVYPSWELDEAWRELLSAQHHDNHECEGLCGFVGQASFDRSEALAMEVADRTLASLAARADGPDGAMLVCNTATEPRDLLLTGVRGQPPALVECVPPFGYRVVSQPDRSRAPRRIESVNKRGVLTLRRGDLELTIDRRRGLVTQITCPDFPEGVLAPDRPLGDLTLRHDGRDDRFEHAHVEIGDEGGQPVISITRQGLEGRQVVIEVRLQAISDGIDIIYFADNLPRSDSRMHAGLQTRIAPAFQIDSLIADHPYAASPVRAEGSFRRKYPTGDWMTSPQVFETVKRPFTSLSWLDLTTPQGDRGLLCVHDGGQQFFREAHGVSSLLSMYDAWDEQRFNGSLRARHSLLPHGALSDGERARLAWRLRGDWSIAEVQDSSRDIPACFGPLEISGADHVLPHAFFRESAKAGEHLPDWAGHRMASDSAGACTHPFVIRLVEWGGRPALVTLKLAGTVALAAKTNLLGESGSWVCGQAPASAAPHLRDTGWLKSEPASPPSWAAESSLRGREIPWSQVQFTVRPREIVTVMADMTLGRKEYRDLDAKREVWATVHRPEGA